MTTHEVALTSPTCYQHKKQQHSAPKCFFSTFISSVVCSLHILFCEPYFFKLLSYLDDPFVSDPLSPVLAFPCTIVYLPLTILSESCDNITSILLQPLYRQSNFGWLQYRATKGDWNEAVQGPLLCDQCDGSLTQLTPLKRLIVV